MRGLVLLVLVGLVAGQDQPQINKEDQQQFQKAPQQQQQQQFYYAQPQQHYAGYNGYVDRNGGVGISAGIGAEPLDLTPYAPGNLITTMIYALGILSLVNLLLGLIPEAAEDRAGSAEALEDTVLKAVRDGEEMNEEEEE